MAEEPEHISGEDARAGATPHVTRYVLAWGTGLVVILFVLIVLIVR